MACEAVRSLLAGGEEGGDGGAGKVALEAVQLVADLVGEGAGCILCSVLICSVAVLCGAGFALAEVVQLVADLVGGGAGAAGAVYAATLASIRGSRDCCLCLCSCVSGVPYCA